jgi:NAD(P)-dependent dehydrogenase (short-subunit alcohol dehydrogenase family)
MKGKTCLVTGATSGIGKEAAGKLARQGATVVVAGRNPEKCAATVQEIRRQTGNPSVEYLLADLSSQRQVRQLAEEFKSRYQRLDVLVNNAGAIVLFRRQSADGIEMTFALNHLSYFLLTSLLLDSLISSSPSRVVNVASSAHQGAAIDFEDLQGTRKYGGLRAYGRSKLANLLFTFELARRLEGTGVTANAVHPGLVATNLLTNNGLAGRLMNLGLRVAGKRVAAGAETLVYLASSPDVAGVNGQYFVEKKAVQSSQASRDSSAAGRLWRVSAEMTGLDLEG